MFPLLFLIVLGTGAGIHSPSFTPKQISMQRQQTKPTVVEGHVYAGKNSAPAAKLYVYIVEGEEECLTDKNGYFRIETWQQLPVHITVQEPGKQTVRHQVKDPSVKQVIRIR